MNRRLPSVLALLTSFVFRPAVSLVHAQDFDSEPRREYNVVDFLWSGSGSGSGEEAGVGTAWVTTTVFRTRVETLLLPTPVLPNLCSACSLSDSCSSCNSDLCSACIPSLSTPIYSPPSSTSPRPNKLVPHQRYWLVTVIKVESPVPDIHVFEKRLEQIYQIAFNRQQEKHLRLDGNNETVYKRSANVKRPREVVAVKMHHFRRKSELGVMELIYSVTLSGRTVDAIAAANDMNYVTDKEVSAQLGFPVLTKAEPYYKVRKSLELAEEGNIWLLVIITICVGLVFLIAVALYLFSSSNKWGRKEEMAKDDGDGVPDLKQQTPILLQTTNSKKSNDNVPTKSALNKGNKYSGALPPTAVKGKVPKESATSYSPKSYLSMPSVRAFPRGDPIPGPLEHMLETESGSTRSLSRHHSEVADPGVIGPAVWNLHCHRISKIEREKEREEEWEGRAARRRFHQLLDDAFSLFPSQSSSLDPLPPPPPHSTSRQQQTEEQEGETVKTVRAWEGREARPLSAGPFHKVKVEPTWMLADSSLRPSDAAAPLIQAIKQELDKFPSVPSSRI